jgi:hypothetical protein
VLLSLSLILTFSLFLYRPPLFPISSSVLFSLSLSLSFSIHIQTLIFCCQIFFNGVVNNLFSGVTSMEELLCWPFWIPFIQSTIIDFTLTPSKRKEKRRNGQFEISMQILLIFPFWSFLNSIGFLCVLSFVGSENERVSKKERE